MSLYRTVTFSAFCVSFLTGRLVWHESVCWYGDPLAEKSYIERRMAPCDFLHVASMVDGFERRLCMISLTENGLHNEGCTLAPKTKFDQDTLKSILKNEKKSYTIRFYCRSSGCTRVMARDMMPFILKPKMSLKIGDVTSVEKLEEIKKKSPKSIDKMYPPALTQAKEAIFPNNTCYNAYFNSSKSPQWERSEFEICGQGKDSCFIRLEARNMSHSVKKSLNYLNIRMGCIETSQCVGAKKGESFRGPPRKHLRSKAFFVCCQGFNCNSKLYGHLYVYVDRFRKRKENEFNDDYNRVKRFRTISTLQFHLSEGVSLVALSLMISVFYFAYHHLRPMAMELRPAHIVDVQNTLEDIPRDAIDTFNCERVT
ncbi:unnamed protein product [Caenorhabditis auriculariae]|uniref:Uncharacterized protein n=1 Tax=Caenorhabditis auriculariae TaxID=2777116 RepID=A0A8S1HWQ5_9PELO|nr:unnamed protein product [Caenorhabditis auriculariae]